MTDAHHTQPAAHDRGGAAAHRLPSMQQVMTALGLSTNLPIASTDADPGLFGPDSLTWRIGKEPILLLGGAGALLAQDANPLIAQGVIDWSAYRTDPFGRLFRTLDWLTTVTYGTTAEAESFCAMLNVIHGGVQGSLPAENATPPQLPAGTRYVANDPELATWVLGTLLDGMLATYRATVGPLSRRDQDRIVREWMPVGRLMNVPASRLWNTYAELQDYIANEVRHGNATVGNGSLEVARTILHGPMSNLPLRPVRDALLCIGLGTMHPVLRQKYNIPWGVFEQSSYEVFSRAVRTAVRHLPGFPRDSAAYRFAMHRVGRALPGRHHEVRQVA